MITDSKQISDITQAKILGVFLNHPEKKISLADIEKEAGLSKKKARENIEELRGSGIEITGKRSLVLTEIPDLIIPPLILCGLKSKRLGGRIFAYKTIGSTSENARRLAESGAPEGTLVVAEKQTRGRGRFMRVWHSPPGKGLYFSLILRPDITITRLPAISLVAALAVSRTIEKLSGLTSLIKWPNDCLLNNKKIAGILVDIAAEFGKVSYAVLGIGINVNTEKKDFPSKLTRRASSVLIESGRCFPRAEILKSFLYEFERLYGNFSRYGLRLIAPQLVKQSAVIDNEIKFKMAGKKYSGRALGYDQNGGLRVSTKEGVKTLTAGEVTLK